MKTHQVLSIFFLVCFTVVGQTPPGQTPPANKTDTETAPATITKITLDSFQQLVQSMGFPCTRPKKDAGKDDTFFTFTAEDYRVTGFIVGEETLLLYNNFTDLHPAPAIPNAWNANNYFSRAFIDSDGTPVLVSDLSLNGGITEEHVRVFIRTYRSALARWAIILTEDRDKKAAEQATKPKAAEPKPAEPKK